MAKSNVTITFSIDTELTGKALAKAIIEEFDVGSAIKDGCVYDGRGNCVSASYGKSKVKVELVK